MVFDVIVIGKGLIGSATAKHLSRSNLKVAIIGPDEPKDFAKSMVFASHYDSGRVQRQLGKNLAMTQLNLLALKEYPRLAVESGIEFHKGSGCLYVNPRGVDSYLQDAEERTSSSGITAKFYDGGKAINEDFPLYHFPNESAGMFEKSPSGHINPKLLLKAQLEVFEKHGGSIIKEVVETVNYEKEEIQIQAFGGATYRCKKIVVTAGAFSNCFDLLRRKLAITLKSETVILARLSKEEAKRLAQIPSLLYEIDNADLEGIYMTQPIVYPDGNYYLKMGANLPEDIFFDTDLAEIKEWFANGDSNAHIKKLESALHDFIPSLSTVAVESKRCILTRTVDNGNPYIGEIEKERVCLGIGNGWSAMNSDGAGYLLSELIINGEFPNGFSQKDFEIIFAD